MDFYQIFVSIASWDKDELISWTQKVEVRGHSITKYAKNTVFGVCFRDISSVH